MVVDGARQGAAAVRCASSATSSKPKACAQAGRVAISRKVKKLRMPVPQRKRRA